MEVIGQTIDDAAGEAFDKTAKILGLPYPGGPVIDKMAKIGNPDAFSFAKPNIAGLNYSFSGLKTSILYTVRDHLRDNPMFIEENVADLCASVQKTVVDILMNKLVKAAKQRQKFFEQGADLVQRPGVGAVAQSLVRVRMHFQKNALAAAGRGRSGQMGNELALAARGQVLPSGELHGMGGVKEPNAAANIFNGNLNFYMFSMARASISCAAVPTEFTFCIPMCSTAPALCPVRPRT